MLTQSSIDYIGAVAQKFGVRRVLLFGSCLYMDEAEAGDIDLAIEGLSEDDALAFAYSFYWVDNLDGKWVDVIRLEDDGDLNPIILDEGVEIYAAEKTHIQSLNLFFAKAALTMEAMERFLAKPEWDEMQLPGMASSLSDVYKSIEKILRTLVIDADPQGAHFVKDDQWHKNLLLRGKTLGLIPEGIESALNGWLAFRHAQIHGYGIDMKENRLRKNIPDAIRSFAIFREHILKLYPELSSDEIPNVESR